MDEMRVVSVAAPLTIPRLSADSYLPAFAALPPGPELAAALAQLDPERIANDDDVLEIIAGYERLAAWTAAQQLAALAEFARRPLTMGVDREEGFHRRGPLGRIKRESVGTEVAATLAVSHNAAMLRTALACSLAQLLPATAAALRAGDIDLSKARIIADACRHLEVDAAALVESRVLPKAAEQTYGPFKKTVLKAAIAADPVLAKERALQCVRERMVIVTPVGDDMAELRAYLPLWQAAAIGTAISAAARTMKSAKAPGDARMMDQLRRRARRPFLLALETGQLPDKANTRLGRRRGASVRLNVTVPASVLLGISNCPGGVGRLWPAHCRRRPQTRRWLDDAANLTDPLDGAVLDVGTKIYRPSADLARHVKLRDGTCVMPGCNRPAIDCDLDHSTRFPDGSTADDNLGPLCERHHIVKHLLDRLTPGPDGRRPGLIQVSRGVFRWILPTGHRYTVRRPGIAPPLTEEMRT